MREIIFDARAMITKGIVVAVNDSGAAQTVDVLTGSGALFGAVEVIQAFGNACVPPADGMQALVLAIGGDPANRVAIVFNPAVRFGNLSPGESVLYGSDGSRVGVRIEGTVEVLGMSLVTLQSPQVTVMAPDGVTVTGPVKIVGSLHVTGGLEVDGLATGNEGGAFQIGNSLVVQGSLAAEGAVTVTGNLTVSGTIYGTVA